MQDDNLKQVQFKNHKNFSIENLKDIFCTNKPYSNKVGSIQFCWVIDRFGCGTTTFYYDEEDNKLRCDSEDMTKEEIKKILCAFVDMAEFIDWSNI